MSIGLCTPLHSQVVICDIKRISKVYVLMYSHRSYDGDTNCPSCHILPVLLGIVEDHPEKSPKTLCKEMVSQPQGPRVPGSKGSHFAKRPRPAGVVASDISILEPGGRIWDQVADGHGISIVYGNPLEVGHVCNHLDDTTWILASGFDTTFSFPES